jgi:hypothetical protein
MQLSRAAFVFIVAAVAMPVIATQNADAKKSVKKAKVAYASGKHYFVPPPPPYVPNLLPSAYGQYYLGSAGQAKSQQNTVESMYGKYVYTRPGYTAPKVVQQNKYVTVWSKL